MTEMTELWFSSLGLLAVDDLGTRDLEKTLEPVRHRRRQAPFNRDGPLSVPVFEIHYATVVERRWFAVHLLGAPDEKVNQHPSCLVVLENLPVLGRLGRAILTLPLEAPRGQELIHVLVSFEQVAFFKSHEQEHILADGDKPGVPDRSGER